MARSLHKLSVKDLLVKISAQDLLDYQSEHRATMRAIWRAQSAKMVVRAVSTFAPRHSKSDLTGPKWQEGCASTCCVFTKHCARTTKNWPGRCQKRPFAQASAFLSRGLQTTAPATENGPEASEVLHTESVSKFTKYCACHTKWLPKPPLILILGRRYRMGWHTCVV